MESVSSKIRLLSGSHFFWKCSRWNLKLENTKKKKKKKKKKINIFRFSANCIWKCFYKSSLFRREYLLSAVNGLTNSTKILNITQRGFFNLNFLQRDREIKKRCCRSVLNKFSAHLPRYLSNGPLKGDFLDIYLTTSFGVRKFNNTAAIRVKKKKKRENYFRFWDNCVGKCCYKLSLLTREYLLSTVNGLTNSRQVFHTTQRDFFKPNCVHRDHKIW